MKKRFTRIASLFLAAAAVCWSTVAMAQATCATAVPVNCGDSPSGTTLGVANDNATSGAGTCVTSVGTAGQHWFTLTTPNCAGNVTIDTEGSGFDTKLHVYTGACGALVCVTGDDDGGSGLLSLVNFAAAANTTYYIRLGGFSTSAGAYVMNVNCNFPCQPFGCTDVAACNYIQPDCGLEGYTGTAGDPCYDSICILDVFCCTVMWDGLCAGEAAADPNCAYCIGVVATDDGSCCFGTCATLVMNDLFGDGWNGAAITLTEASSGNSSSYSLASGASASVSICLNSGCYIADVTSGSFPSEVSWQILDGLGNLVASGGAPATGVYFSADGSICIPGCTNPLATNYDPAATIDDGTCVFCAPGEGLVIVNMFDSFGDGWNGAAYLLVDDIGNIIATGSLNTASFGNQFSAGFDAFCIPVGCYYMIVTGGTFPSEISWNISDAGGNIIISGGAPATLVGFDFGGVGGCTIYGCTDPACNNYNSFANVDDGSCECPPANDDCANGEDVVCGSSVPGTFEFANDDSAEYTGDCGVSIDAGGVWYDFVGTGDQVTLTTCGSAPVVDTKIHIFSGSCGSLTCIGANDDACTGFGSTITFTSVNGTPYHILVSPFGGPSSNSYTLDVTCQPCVGPPAPNDDNAGALLQLSGLPFTQSLCCVNPDNSPCLGFQTGYGVWFYMNACDPTCGLADTFDFFITNDSGANIGMTVYEDLNGNGIAEDVEAIACCPIVTGACGGDISAFYTLTACNDFYFLAYTTDPVNCGNFTFTTTLGYLGCTDPDACNFSGGCVNIDDGSCEYISCGFTPANDLCGGATLLPCGATLSGTTGGSTATDYPGTCGPPPPGVGVPGLDCAQSGYIDDGGGCAASVCGYDSFCCTVFWDGICAAEAAVDPNCVYCVGAGAPTPGAGVWYVLPTGNGDTYTVSTCGSTIDSRIEIVEGACGAFTACIGEEDADFVSCGFFDQDDVSITFITTPGSTYYVYVMTEGTDGLFDISLECVPTIFGCTNAAACNYNPLANWDDGSCDYFSCACGGGPGTALQFNMTDLFGDGWDTGSYTITDGAGNVVASGTCDTADYVVDQDNFVGCESGFDILCLQDGCYTITVGGSVFNSEIGWNVQDELGNTLASGGSPATVSLSIGGVCGCTDPAACNWDPLANVDDGSCCLEECVNINTSDLFGDGWNGAGWTLTDSGGNVVAGGTNLPGPNPQTEALCIPAGCYTFDVTGGTFPSEISWNITDGLGNVLLAGGAPFNGPLSIGGTCGCTDPGACNYDATAVVDNGTCCFENCATLILTDLFGDGWDNGVYVITALSDGSIVTSGTLAGGSLGVVSLCLASGCYNITVGGSNFNSELGYIIVGADLPVSGGAPSSTDFSIGGSNCTPTCQEPFACNYDPSGGINDCTLCEYTSCQGCTYACADNYDPAATIDDGTCVGCDNPCPADLDGNGFVNVADLLLFMADFGLVCP